MSGSKKVSSINLFTSNTDVIIPSNITSVIVECIGNGANGRPQNTPFAQGSPGGGGGGGYSRYILTPDYAITYKVYFGPDYALESSTIISAFLKPETPIYCAANEAKYRVGGLVGIGDVTYKGGSGGGNPPYGYGGSAGMYSGDGNNATGTSIGVGDYNGVNRFSGGGGYRNANGSIYGGGGGRDNYNFGLGTNGVVILTYLVDRFDDGTIERPRLIINNI